MSPKPVRKLGLDDARTEAAKEESGGQSRTECPVECLAERGKLWLGRVTRDEFLNLVFQETDETRLVTSRSLNRTLGAVAQHVLEAYGSLDAVAESEATPGALDPRWWAKAALLAREFDWSSFGHLWLVPVKSTERTVALATHYICEGNHRAIASAVRLVTGGLDWQDCEAIVADERLECC